MADTPRKPKLYHSIREVSQLLAVKPHVLRYWETQFSFLKPKKNRAGNRMYQAKDLDQLRAIKELLYERKYTIAGARRRLLQDRREPDQPTEAVAGTDGDLEYLKPEYRKKIREVKTELVALKAWLENGG